LIQLYADENFPLRVVEELRRLGHDVLTAYEDGKANQSVSDQDVLARATALRRVVITLDRVDFKRLHRQHPEHSGIVICTEDPDRIGQAQRISNALKDAGEVGGKLVRVHKRA
jgi:predicted nuclease of predicted toxin-antitoxin system